MKEPFDGDMRVFTVRQFIESHVELFRERPDEPLLAALATTLETCLEGGRGGLALLITMCALIDVKGRTEDAFAVLAPLSRDLGLPVGLID